MVRLPSLKRESELRPRRTENRVPKCTDCQELSLLYSLDRNTKTLLAMFTSLLPLIYCCVSLELVVTCDDCVATTTVLSSFICSYIGHRVSNDVTFLYAVFKEISVALTDRMQSSVSYVIAIHDHAKSDCSFVQFRRSMCWLRTSF